MAKTKIKATARKTVRAKKTIRARKVATTKRIVRAKNVRTTKTTAFQPLTTLQNSFNSVMNYFK